jgi:hypothetical protein
VPVIECNTDANWNRFNDLDVNGCDLLTSITVEKPEQINVVTHDLKVRIWDVE